jgi:hypothetical protein
MRSYSKATQLILLQRNLNNCFAYDLVPSPSVITAAVRAARRVNDFPSAVRVFEGMFYNTSRYTTSPVFACADERTTVEMSSYLWCCT